MIRLFRVFIPKSVLALVVCDALILFACYVAATYILFPETADIYLLYEEGLPTISIATVSGVLALYYRNLYSDFRIRSRIVLLQEFTLVVGIVLLVQAALSYFLREAVVPRSIILTSTALQMIVFIPWRLLYTNYIYKGLGIDRVLFVGSDATGADIACELRERPELGFMAIGFVTDASPQGSEVCDYPVLGPTSQLREIVAEHKPDHIVVSMAERRQVLPMDALLDIRFSGVRIEEAAGMFEVAFGRVSTRSLRPSQLIFSAELGPQKKKMRLQSFYSFVLAVIGLIIAAPIMLLVAVAVRLTSRGPILFRQTRVGLGGKHFTLLKFRSMVVDAEAETGAVWAKRNDPRVTRIGGFLRKTRLDELPQLFNVLAGQMSIVGPRPERPEFVSVLTEQIPFYRQRHSVKPGVTGWAQINYKYGETIPDTIIKLEYDLYYIKNLSMSLDGYIIFHTLKVMLFSSHGQ
jgi:exopolysaccharide biosynthesis polyprenyl glycosylphosphotransferase